MNNELNDNIEGHNNETEVTEPTIEETPASEEINDSETHEKPEKTPAPEEKVDSEIHEQPIESTEQNTVSENSAVTESPFSLGEETSASDEKVINTFPKKKYTFINVFLGLLFIIIVGLGFFLLLGGDISVGPGGIGPASGGRGPGSPRVTP